MKGLLVEVYHSRNDCTNGGVSSMVYEAVIVGDGIPEIFAPSENAPALKLVRRIICGSPYLHLEPVESGQYMYGGNIAYSSDGRFPNDYPLKIHDRQE